MAPTPSDPNQEVIVTMRCKKDASGAASDSRSRSNSRSSRSPIRSEEPIARSRTQSPIRLEVQKCLRQQGIKEQVIESAVLEISTDLQVLLNGGSVTGATTLGKLEELKKEYGSHFEFERQPVLAKKGTHIHTTPGPLGRLIGKDDYWKAVGADIGIGIGIAVVCASFVGLFYAIRTSKLTFSCPSLPRGRRSGSQARTVIQGNENGHAMDPVSAATQNARGNPSTETSVQVPGPTYSGRGRQA